VRVEVPVRRRRTGVEWAALLDELNHELASGRVYKRDLYALGAGIDRLNAVYLRRLHER